MSEASERAPIAVTGLSLLTPVADDPSALFAALLAGTSPLADQPDGTASARIGEFDPKRYASIRGMRVYPRNTQLQICAAAQALSHAGLELGKIEPTALGTITASSYAHIETLIEYDRGLVTVGIQRTNPTLFPLSLPSAPGALTALSLNAKAFAITLSDGDASGLAAVALGARMLAQGRAEVCVVTSAFTQCAELTTSVAQAGMLTNREGCRPFDRESRGTALGEVAVALVLEPLARARARAREPLGYLHGHAATFASTPSLRERALARAGQAALVAAAVTPSQLGLVSASASGLAESDAAEARGLVALLGDAASAVPVTASKALLGESLDASGLVQLATAILAFRAGRAPGIPRLTTPSVPALRYLTESAALTGTHALLTSISHAGACSASILSVSP